MFVTNRQRQKRFSQNNPLLSASFNVKPISTLYLSRPGLRSWTCHSVLSSALALTQSGRSSSGWCCHSTTQRNPAPWHLLKAGPLDLSFWSFLTFLHHGIEKVERHLLWKLHNVIAEIFVRVKVSYSSVCRLSYATNFRTATVVSDTLVCVYAFHMLLNFVLSAKSTKYRK